MLQKVSFFWGLTLYSIGSIATIYPGSEWIIFLPVIVLAMIGFFWKNTAVRILAVIIVIHSTVIIIDGLHRRSKLPDVKEEIKKG